MKDNVLFGVAMMALGMLLIPVGDAITKHLLVIAPYNADFLAWSRFVIGGVILIPIAVFGGFFKNLGFDFYKKQAVRGLLLAATITCIITATKYESLSNVYGAFFIGPALATVLAVLILKERVRPIEWLAVAVGFAGVLLVVRPGFDIGTGIFWALAAGTGYGSFLVATRWAANSGPPLAQLAAQMFFGFMALASFGINDLVTHGIREPVLLLAQGLSSGLANMLSIMALARAPAAYLAPIVYVQILSATAISLLFFADIINPVAGIGLGLIVCAGLIRVWLIRSA